MRFIIGLIMGLASGLAAALLLAPERVQHRQEEEEPLGGEAPSGDWLGEDNETLARLRRATQGLREQVREAWQEARQAAQEAEEEIRARYHQGAPKARR